MKNSSACEGDLPAGTLKSEKFGRSRNGSPEIEGQNSSSVRPRCTLPLVWRDGGRETILLETCFVAECVAPVALHADRFLPMTPVLVVVDHACADLSDDAEIAAAKLEKGDVFPLLDRGAVKKKLLPAMLEKARQVAAERLEKVVAATVAKMSGQLSHEVQRLRDLAEINDHVRPAEIAATVQQQTDLQTALAATHLRLDAVRLILRCQ